jgi:hypothetical protein
MSQTIICPDPQASIACAEQRRDARGRQLFPMLRAPSNKTHSIEPEESRIGSYPNVAVCGLRDGCWNPTEIAILQAPGSMTILRDATCGVERESPSRAADG